MPKMSKIKNAKKNEGFTLIGVIIFLVFLGIALPSLIIAINQTSKDLVLAEKTAVGTMLAQDIMEEIRSRLWDHNSPAGGGAVADAFKTNPLGPEAGETRGGIAAAGYNDIDDYNGLDASPPEDASGTALTEYSDFRIRVTVQYAGASDFDTEALGPPLPNYKRIYILVSWNNDTQSVDLATVMTNY